MYLIWKQLLKNYISTNVIKLPLIILVGDEDIMVFLAIKQLKGLKRFSNFREGGVERAIKPIMSEEVLFERFRDCERWSVDLVFVTTYLHACFHFHVFISLKEVNVETNSLMEWQQVRMSSCYCQTAPAEPGEEEADDSSIRLPHFWPESSQPVGHVCAFGGQLSSGCCRQTVIWWDASEVIVNKIQTLASALLAFSIFCL